MAADPLFAVFPVGGVFHGRYRLVRCIKAGGMGAVYEVVHIETQRRRALKIMLPSLVANGDLRKRFRLEATIAANIESEHIVETFDAGIDDETGAPYLVMELLRGEDLAAQLERRGRLPPSEVVLLLSQAASALNRTHAAGVVHRDLKPENLFITLRDDGTPKLKILDFGIAKLVSDSTQQVATTKIVGTPLYMSPEQIRGDARVDRRSDIYALGQIAFALLTGRAYWYDAAGEGGLYGLLMKVAGGCIESATSKARKYGVELPATFDAWFLRSTAPEPRDRFETTLDLVDDLARAFDIPLARGSETIATLPSKSALESALETSTPSGAAPNTRPLTEPGAVDHATPAKRDGAGDREPHVTAREQAASTHNGLENVSRTLSEPLAAGANGKGGRSLVAPARWFGGLAIVACAIGAAALFAFNAPPNPANGSVAPASVAATAASASTEALSATTSAASPSSEPPPLAAIAPAASAPAHITAPALKPPSRTAVVSTAKEAAPASPSSANARPVVRPSPPTAQSAAAPVAAPSATPKPPRPPRSFD